MAAKAKTTAVARTFPPAREVDEFTEGMIRDAEKSLDFIKAIEIHKPADREFASNALSEVARRFDVNDAKRKSWVEPLKSIASDIDAAFRPGLKAMKAGIEILKEKIGRYDIEQENKRVALLRASVEASRKGDQDAAEVAYEKAEKFAPAEGGAAAKIEWSGEVVDASAIPREYLCPDVKKLEAVTKAHGADPKIPGWRAYQVAAVRTSRKGVA